jgi:hypothetical protein
MAREIMIVIETRESTTMEIRVEGSLDQALRVLKRKLAKEGY